MSQILRSPKLESLGFGFGPTPKTAFKSWAVGSCSAASDSGTDAGLVKPHLAPMLLATGLLLLICCIYSV